MLCIIDSNTDPYFNLAAEEYLLTSFKEPVFRLWRNSSSVIVGRYQNTLAEINSSFVSHNSIPVVRRLTGGGAVFHDLGNVNFTFIDKRTEDEDTSSMFKRFTLPIIEALRNLRVNASLEGRNDLMIDGKKFSGNAICIHKNRLLQHGTLLFNSSITNLSDALNTRPEKFIGKSIKSNVSRVTNISEHLIDEMDVVSFMDYLNHFIPQYFSEKGMNCTPYFYSTEDLNKINTLKEEKYETKEWNYGESPEYRFNNISKQPCGLIEIHLNISKGIITDCKIMGDFFFTRPIEELEENFVGIPHKYDDIYSILCSSSLDLYFGGISPDILTSLFIE